MENVIDLRRLWLIVRRNGWLIISNHFTFKGLQGVKVKMLLKNKLVRRIYSFLVHRKVLKK